MKDRVNLVVVVVVGGVVEEEEEEEGNVLFVFGFFGGVCIFLGEEGWPGEVSVAGTVFPCGAPWCSLYVFPTRVLYVAVTNNKAPIHVVNLAVGVQC